VTVVGTSFIEVFVTVAVSDIVFVTVTVEVLCQKARGEALAMLIKERRSKKNFMETGAMTKQCLGRAELSLLEQKRVKRGIRRELNEGSKRIKRGIKRELEEGWGEVRPMQRTYRDQKPIGDM
jgi:hypothetical protein